MEHTLITFSMLLLFCSCSDSKKNTELEITQPLNEEELTENINEDSIMNEEVNGFKFLALGDSYTIGESVSEQLRWPVQLVDRLISENFEFKSNSPEIIARTGWTTDELQLAIDESNPQPEYDLVSLLIGVNNQFRGYSIDTYKTEFESLLQRAITFAKNDTAKVFVVSIPDWGAMPFAEGRDRNKIAQEINAFNAINLTITKQYNVQYFDITPISRKALVDSDLVAEDGLHPSGEMYRLWVEDILLWAKQTLSK